jgi:hypothetical protein
LLVPQNPQITKYTVRKEVTEAIAIQLRGDD